MDNLIDCLNDISQLNIIYTIFLLATSANNIKLNEIAKFIEDIITMNYTESFFSTETALGYANTITTEGDVVKSGLLIRLVRRFLLITDNSIVYLQNQINEHTATSIASFSVLIIVLSIICCIIISLMREEERKIKEQYKKLNGGGSSQSFITVNSHNSQHHHHHHQYTGHYQKLGSGSTFVASSTSTTSNNPLITNRPIDPQKLHVIELRRETYFGLVRLLKPGCRTIVLLCDAQSKLKLLTKFYHCIYPYRKNKTLQFAFLLIEKNISWYKDLLKLALNEKRDLHINPINCIGTVLVLNGFKKYFSVYHASDSRCDLDEQFILLEESLLDNFSDWLERLFTGRASRYYVKYWPNQMR